MNRFVEDFRSFLLVEADNDNDYMLNVFFNCLTKFMIMFETVTKIMFVIEFFF